MAKGAHARTASGLNETRPDRTYLRAQFQANKKIILATQSVCAICGRPVDKSLKSPDPMSASIDHIIPVSKHGDPVAMDNLQLTHRACNRAKSDKLPGVPLTGPNKGQKIGPPPAPRFPLSQNWSNF